MLLPSNALAEADFSEQSIVAKLLVGLVFTEYSSCNSGLRVLRRLLGMTHQHIMPPYAAASDFCTSLLRAIVSSLPSRATHGMNGSRVTMREKFSFNGRKADRAPILVDAVINHDGDHLRHQVQQDCA